MSVEDAMRVADIFEADDIISVPAMACRVMVAEIRNLTNQIVELKLQVNELHREETTFLKEQAAS